MLFRSMPGKIEGYRQDKGQLVLTDRMVVEKFIQLDNGSWVPAKATMNLIDDNGRAWTGNSMELDAEHSSWNSIKSDELFLAKSLPEVNHELVGWKQYYSPALLAAEKGADDFLKEADRKEHRRNLTSGIVFLAVSLFTSLSIIIYMASRRGQKPNM